MSYETATVTLPDGKVIEYVNRPGGAVTAVLVHGYADSWYSFKGVLDYLPKEFTAWALSLPGHGGSSKPERGYSIPGYAKDVLSFMDAKRIAEAVIVGHSMGSFIAQEIALSAPARVAKMILIASADTADNAVLRDLHRQTLELKDPVPATFAQEFQGDTCINPIDPAMSLERIVEESRKLPAHVWVSALAGLIDYRSAGFDATELNALRVPTLVLGGRLDNIFVASSQERLAQALPRAEIWLDPDSGHSINWESPERTARQIADFALSA
jgi:pimeloyl-ACP methyl ester carboxylesterase